MTWSTTLPVGRPRETICFQDWPASDDLYSVPFPATHQWTAS